MRLALSSLMHTLNEEVDDRAGGRRQRGMRGHTGEATVVFIEEGGWKSDGARGHFEFAPLTHRVTHDNAPLSSLESGALVLSGCGLEARLIRVPAGAPPVSRETRSRCSAVCLCRGVERDAVQEPHERCGRQTVGHRAVGLEHSTRTHGHSLPASRAHARNGARGRTPNWTLSEHHLTAFDCHLRSASWTHCTRTSKLEVMRMRNRNTYCNLMSVVGVERVVGDSWWLVPRTVSRAGARRCSSCDVNWHSKTPSSQRLAFRTSSE